MSIPDMIYNIDAGLHLELDHSFPYVGFCSIVHSELYPYWCK